MVQIHSNETYTGPDRNEFATFPYPLSAFQKVAIGAIVDGNHVLVTAPTGSGKTLPAEFAIDHFIQKGKKLIYTSPIKALSNQKFYEFQKKFPEITFGLITGDNKINPAAQVLIMTTEILMNALFQRGSAGSVATVAAEASQQSFQIDLETELACVVFDEIHYINDAGRGHVWEKTLMMLAPMTHVQMVMLSATMHAPAAFAQWIEHMIPSSPNSIQVIVSSTNHRVVPLGHYMFLTATESLFKKIKDKTTEQEYRGQILDRLLPLQDAQGKFQDKTLTQVRLVQQSLLKHRIDIHRKYTLNRLLEHLRDHEMLPALTFILSRKQVEQCAQEITTNLLPFDSKIPYTTAQECERLLRNKLSNWQEYTAMPEYRTLVALLEKGIGIHHSGMIPVFRELVEMCISQKSILLLIATESFSIGLDCPIKTVVFAGFQKFDGQSQRMLEPHEYKQMAGRAGRRGLDKIGYCVHCANLFTPPSATEYRHLLSGKPEPFLSKLTLEDGLILRLIAQGHSTTEAMMDFVGTSYYSENLQNQVRAQTQLLETLRIKSQDCLKTIEGQNTPYPTCIDYLKLEEQLDMASHKRQKEIAKEREQMVKIYPELMKDVPPVKNYTGLLQEIELETRTLERMRQYMGQILEKTCGFLEERACISKVSDSVSNSVSWMLTERGELAAMFQEVNGMWMASMMEKTNGFADLNPKQMVAVFAALCWSNFSSGGESERESGGESEESGGKDAVLNACLEHGWNLNRDLEEKREAYHLPEVESVPQTLTQWIEWARPWLQWCELQNEMECRGFIQQQMGFMSPGDFVKMILKMVAIKKECERVATRFHHVEWLFKLSQVEDLICKYIATSQSLYY